MSSESRRLVVQVTPRFSQVLMKNVVIPVIADKRDSDLPVFRDSNIPDFRTTLFKQEMNDFSFHWIHFQVRNSDKSDFRLSLRKSPHDVDYGYLKNVSKQCTVVVGRTAPTCHQNKFYYKTYPGLPGLTASYDPAKRLKRKKAEKKKPLQKWFHSHRITFLLNSGCVSSWFLQTDCMAFA